ncbi:MAG TPA: BMP family ABC transporter substrate-binding protein [Arenibaculum sp.]|nr:BMP family ABC transporter substrate-binding protein [Arenibaculum sp.]
MMPMRCLRFLLSLFLPAVAQAAGPVPEVTPAVIYAVGQKFDRSFNEGAHTGAERFSAATGIAYLEYEPRNPAQFEQAVAALARRGATDIVCVGFYYATPLQDLAPRFPDIRFTIVDAVVEAPNVRSVVFEEHEGSFLTGVIAALTSRTGSIGFVGAMDIPLIRKFIAGYEQGARHVRPDIEVLVNFVGSTPEAFNDPLRGAEVARSQFERGVDVVFAGAGTSNFGVFQQAVDAGRLAIGVDSDQGWMHPDHILTSMLKRVDLAVERSFEAARAGAWRPGTVELGLREGGVDYAFTDQNRDLIAPGTREATERARSAIVEGRIEVRPTP